MRLLACQIEQRGHRRRAPAVQADWQAGYRRGDRPDAPRHGARRQRKPRESGASPSLANVRTAWRVGSDLALSSRAYACSVAAETYLNRASKNDLSCCRSLSRKSVPEIGRGLVRASCLITPARSRGELAPALPIAQVAINDIPTANLINCMVLWYCVSPNSIGRAYRRRRFQARDGHHKGMTISEDTRTAASRGSLSPRDNLVAVMQRAIARVRS